MISPAPAGLAAAAGWFCVFVVLQLFSLRAGWGGARSLSTALLVSIAGMLATIAAFVGGGPHFLPLTLAMAMGLLANACLFVLYVPALYTVLTSLSVQTVILLDGSGGALPEAELYARFAGRPLFESRLRTLMQSGYVAESGGRYRLTSRGRRVARPFAALKELWRLGAGG
jgi:hypothetical protein